MKTRFFALAAVVLSGTSAQAQITATYNSSAVFQAAVGPVTIENFTSHDAFPLGSTLNSASSYPGLINPGDIQAGVTYSVASGPLLIDGGAGFDGGFLDASHSWGSQGALTATFDNPVSAFGFAHNGFVANQTVVIHALSGDYSYVTNPDPCCGLSFLGFQSNSAEILSVSFDNGGDYYAAFDDFQWSSQSVETDATPEPASLALLGSGLLGIAAIRRRRRA
jgi:hypothetical protein